MPNPGFLTCILLSQYILLANTVKIVVYHFICMLPFPFSPSKTGKNVQHCQLHLLYIWFMFFQSLSQLHQTFPTIDFLPKLSKKYIIVLIVYNCWQFLKLDQPKKSSNFYGVWKLENWGRNIILIVLESIRSYHLMQ